MGKIYVWGTGINAINFTHLCESDEIIAYIDNYAIINSFDIVNIPIVHPSLILSPYSVYEKRFIVIATSENVFWEIKRQLDREGYSEFRDYCYYKIYKKKIAVIYGNCHTLPIKQGLEASATFSATYGFYPLKLIQNIYGEKGEDLESTVFEKCDLFIHQYIQEKNKYGIEYSSNTLLKKLKSSCITISIPNLYGMPKFLFPQIDERLPERRIGNVSYFSFRDRFIEEWKNNGYSNEYIVEKIKNGEVIKEASLERNYEEFTNKLLNREKEWDIKISGWINKHIRKVNLFYDINHPTNEVFKFIISSILNYLSISEEMNLEYLVRLDNYEIPIYGQIMKSIDMMWKNEYIFRKYTQYSITNTQINLEQYVNQYILWYF